MKDKKEEMERAVRDLQAGLDPGGKNSELIFDYFYPVIRDHIYRRNISEGVREELINEAFLHVFKNIGDLRDVGTVEFWVKKAARNVLFDYWRREGRRPSLVSWDAGGGPEEFDRADESSEPDPFRSLLAREGVQIVAEARKHLTARQYDCWALHNLQGLDYREIAEIMGAAEATIRSTVRTARLKILEFMKSRFTKSDDDQ